MRARFTVDGSEDLEGRLEDLCTRVRDGICARIPRKEIEAIVLGGGYGRGEGGVLRTATGDWPYNDLEFYVFLNGPRLWQERRHGGAVRDLGERLSIGAGLHVEFKIDCLERWKSSPVSMFSYDLASARRVILGAEDIFKGCEHHLDGAAIPLEEATRLMFNRCSGLLLAREKLQKSVLTSEDADFAGRNLAKMQLAFGDAVLAAHGQYHWSARERGRRCACFPAANLPPWWAEVPAHHAAGLEFKLHPSRAVRTADELGAEHRRLAGLAMQLWLWLESRRLKESFRSASDYALSDLEKCPGTSAWRNHFLNLRTFGPKAAAFSRRYPRERLFNALALLLWETDVASQPRFLRRLQRELQTDALDWAGLVNVFKRIWPCYG
ncbi:MAG TPA: hypothetical protein VGO59_08785 [Verrucomicrobiae bacterium]